jgi:hypothetical protein
VRWFVFAKHADDRLRSVYWERIARLRRREMDRRREALAMLPSSNVSIPGRDGYAASCHDRLEDVAAVVDEARRLRERLGPRWQADDKNYLLSASLTGLEPSSPLLRFALGEQVVAAAARYLGVVPKLTGVALMASPHVSGSYAGSQLYHCDWEDVRQVKVFVHCSGVAEENGPLRAVAAAASARVKTAVGYRYGGPHFRLADDVVEPLVAGDEIATFTGPEGGTTFIDTSSCLHLGSRLRAGAAERLVLQFQYLTPAAFDLVLASPRRPPIASSLDGLTALQRIVVA